MIWFFSKKADRAKIVIIFGGIIPLPEIVVKIHSRFGTAAQFDPPWGCAHGSARLSPT